MREEAGTKDAGAALAVRFGSADRFQVSGEIAAPALPGARSLVLLAGETVVGRLAAPVTPGGEASVPFRIPVEEAAAVEEGGSLALALDGEGGRRVLGTAPVRSRVAGALDRCNEALVRGWAANLNCPDQPLEVEILLNGQSQGFVVANRRRSDLERMDKALAATAFLFKFARPLDLPRGETAVITARIRGTGIELGNSPWWIARAYESLPLLAG
ncbi:hypothetical protein [Teichococcus aerofrigidensis]